MKDFFEQKLEDIIFENKETIHQKGLCKLYKVNFRQFRLPSGKEIDILSCEVRKSTIYFNIIELKRDVIDDASLTQAMNYLVELNASVPYGRAEFKITLVGKRCGDLSISHLICGDYPISAFVYDYTVNGIEFTEMVVGKTFSKIDAFRETISAIQYGIIPDDRNLSVNFQQFLNGCPNGRFILEMCVMWNKSLDDTLKLMNEIRNSDDPFIEKDDGVYALMHKNKPTN